MFSFPLGGPLAQLVEQATLNRQVVGSIPTRSTKKSRLLGSRQEPFLVHPLEHQFPYVVELGFLQEAARTHCR